MRDTKESFEAARYANVQPDMLGSGQCARGHVGEAAVGWHPDAIVIPFLSDIN